MNKKFNVKILKKNQIIVYTIALMLVVAGYLNYNNTQKDLNATIETTSRETSSSIGDAEFVSANVSEENVMENTETIETNYVINEDYFSNSKLERDNMYSQMLEVYENMLNSEGVSGEQKQIAQEEITKINNIKNKIMISENLIKTKGFKNCIIFVNEKSINTIIEDEELTTEEIAQIQNIISRELNANVDNIHISNK